MNLQEMAREFPALAQFFSHPTQPDHRLAVDMGQKAFTDCVEVLKRISALVGNPMDATIVVIVAIAALNRWKEDAKANAIAADGPEEERQAFIKLIDTIENTFRMSEEELAARDAAS